MRERNWKFNVYLNSDEKAMLVEKAEKTGLTFSSLIRYLILNYKPKEKPPKEFYDSVEYIRRTGNVLNQIATRMHYLGYVEDMNALRKTVTDLNNLVLNIKEYYLLPEKVGRDKDNVD